MLIPVKRYHDHERTLHDFLIERDHIIAVGPLVKQWGEQGGTPVRQVWLMGGSWFFLHDDGSLLAQLQQGPSPW